MRIAVRCVLIAGLLLILVAMPLVKFRAEYAHGKRLHEVAPGILYRSGQLTADGFRDALARTKARTVVNCQNEFPDPVLSRSFFDRSTIRESELCRELGVRYVHLEPDLCSNRTDPHARPRVIDQFLALMDDPANYPVLLHCKAGLHRTGVLSAVFRMEYQNWDAVAATTELKMYGFGDSDCTAANDYIQQYILNYDSRRSAGVVKSCTAP